MHLRSRDSVLVGSRNWQKAYLFRCAPWESRAFDTEQNTFRSLKRRLRHLAASGTHNRKPSHSLAPSHHLTSPLFSTTLHYSLQSAASSSFPPFHPLSRIFEFSLCHFAGSHRRPPTVSSVAPVHRSGRYKRFLPCSLSLPLPFCLLPLHPLPHHRHCTGRRRRRRRRAGAGGQHVN